MPFSCQEVVTIDWIGPNASSQLRDYLHQAELQQYRQVISAGRGVRGIINLRISHCLGKVRVSVNLGELYAFIGWHITKTADVDQTRSNDSSNEKRVD